MSENAATAATCVIFARHYMLLYITLVPVSRELAEFQGEVHPTRIIRLDSPEIVDCVNENRPPGRPFLSFTVSFPWMS